MRYKKITFFAIILSVLLLIALPQNTMAEGMVFDSSSLTAESAILMDMESGTVLFEKNADTQMYPASITKIVTAIVALETANMDDIVTISKEARYEEGTRVYLAEGEQVSMKRLLYALMLNSGNDAATAIAEHIDGTKEQFARRMNEFLKSKVGVTNTNFINPSGLPDPKHVTTARDMAQIARYAMQNSTFRAIVSTRKMPWKGKEWDSNLINHNKLIGSYEGTTGIKNGYTDEAKSTLVASAKRNGMEIVGVVLKSKTGTDLYQDITELLDYGFQNFERKSIFVSNQTVMLGTGDSEKEYIARKPISTVVPIGSSPFHWVNSNGDVVLQTPLGQQTIGKLEAVPGKSTQPAIDKFVAVPSRSTYDYIVFALWLMLNIFLGLIGGLTIQRKIRSVREQRRAENWTN